MASHGVGLHLTNNGNDGAVEVDEDDEGNVSIKVTADQATMNRLGPIEQVVTDLPE